MSFTPATTDPPRRTHPNPTAGQVGFRIADGLSAARRWLLLGVKISPTGPVGELPQVAVYRLERMMLRCRLCRTDSILFVLVHNSA